MSEANVEKVARNKALCDLYRQGNRSMREVAGIFGVTLERVRQILRKHDVPIRPQGSKITYSTERGMLK